MKKYALVAAIAAVAIAVPLSVGSSHREAPLIALDPTGDNTDTYAFTANDASGKLTLVANWIPFEDPAGGPNFYRFDDNARYYLNVDNTGEGVPDVRYLFDFNTKVRNRGSFLYGLGGEITSLRDPDLNVIQTYKLTLERLRNGRIVSTKVLGKGLPTPPNNVGPKTTPNYEQTASAAVRSLRGGVKVFAGQRDDPFYASLGRIFDTINLTGAGLGNMGGGVDDLAGYSVHSTILQVPEAQVTRNHRRVTGPDANNAVVGVWSTTERRSLSVGGRGSGPYRQISRLGNPLVNEVIIPLGQKDRFNRTTPDRDAELYGKYVLRPELAKVLNAFPGRAGTIPTDTIHINLGTPPSASPNRLGVIAGDNAGYPNGRRLADDVVDIDLRVVAGVLKGNDVPLGDGVDQNNLPFLDQFPYVAHPKPGANPDAGFGSELKTAGKSGVGGPVLVSNGTAPAGPVVSGPGIGTGGEGSSPVLWLLLAAGAASLVAIGTVAGRARRGTSDR